MYCDPPPCTVMGSFSVIGLKADQRSKGPGDQQSGLRLVRFRVYGSPSRRYNMALGIL